MLKRLIQGVFLLAFLSFGPSTLAAEYSLQPSLSLNGTYNDNVQLAAQNGDETSGYTLTPQLVFKRDDLRSLLSINASAPFRRFSLGRYDTDDQTASLSYLRRFERGTLSVTGSERRESSRTFEDQDTDVGFSQTEASRAYAESISFSGSYSLTSQDTLQGSLSGQQRRYDSNKQRSYDYLSANGLWQHTFSERLTLQTQAGYSKYLPDDLISVDYTDAVFTAAANQGVTGAALQGQLQACAGGLINVSFPSFTNPLETAPCFEAATYNTEQGSVNLKLGLIYAFTEKLTLDVLVGGTETGSKRDSFSVAKQGKFLNRDKTHSSAYEASLSYRGERLSSSLHGSRKNEATTSGSLQIADRIEWKNSWKAYTHDTLELDLIWFQRKEDAQNNVNSNASSIDNQHYIARIQYSHRLSHDWSTRFRYQYRSKVFDNSSDNAERSDVMMSLSWSPTRWQWSR